MKKKTYTGCSFNGKITFKGGEQVFTQCFKWVQTILR